MKAKEKEKWTKIYIYTQSLVFHGMNSLLVYFLLLLLLLQRPLLASPHFPWLHSHSFHLSPHQPLTSPHLASPRLTSSRLVSPCLMLCLASITSLLGSISRRDLSLHLTSVVPALPSSLPRLVSSQPHLTVWLQLILLTNTTIHLNLTFSFISLHRFWLHLTSTHLTVYFTALHLASRHCTSSLTLPQLTSFVTSDFLTTITPTLTKTLASHRCKIPVLYTLISHFLSTHEHTHTHFFSLPNLPQFHHSYQLTHSRYNTFSLFLISQVHLLLFLLLDFSQTFFSYFFSLAVSWML